MNQTANVNDAILIARPLKLRDHEREALAKSRYSKVEMAALEDLFAQFKRAYYEFTIRDAPPHLHQCYLSHAIHLCAQIMLELNCTYWDFNWEKLLAWKQALLEREAQRPKIWRQALATNWARLTSTLFFLGVLPYSEEIYQTYHRHLADRWLGKERADRIAERFIQAAEGIGYRYTPSLRKHVVGVLLSVLVFSGKIDVAELTKADLEGWQAHTRRTKRVAYGSVTCIQKVLAAMGHLGGEAPRLTGFAPPDKFGWGRTAPGIVATFERFLDDMKTIRAPGTVNSYRVSLRRFGDWLGEYAPSLQSVAELRRTHIEAYKRAVKEMRCGDYTNVGQEFRTVNVGEPLSRAHQVRALSCVRVLCEHIDALEYPERPGRKLWVRGDTPRLDEELPRAIPDADWRLLVDTVERLTLDLAAEYKLPQPFERLRAIFAVLFECGLRAGELCRLDTGCLMATQDQQTGEQTHWLRVPIGKLHNDRMIPVRPQLVTAVDEWMTRRGRQPATLDQRTDKTRDLLFTWKGHPLSPHLLNCFIKRLCALAGTSSAFTSHQFRHTLAVQWRARGMRIETISRMLGHKSLRMTMRYAAVMPPLLRQEFETAFAAIDEEHRATAQVRVLLSPEAHVEAQVQWRESLFVDLGIGWCGLTAYHPCETRLACHSCPNYIPDQEGLPLLERQRANLIELRGIGSRMIGGARKQELDREMSSAINGIERSITTLGGAPLQIQEEERSAKGVLANANTKGAESHAGDFDHRG